MKKLVMTAAVCAAAFATPAFAQDESNFAGPYVGLYAGYDHVTISDGVDSGSKDGVAFGALAGYNFDLGSAVVGIEAELGDASTRQEEVDIFTLGDRGVLSANFDAFIGARAGVKASDTMLIYAKAGYAHTSAKLQYDDGAGSTFAESDTLDGVRVGGGIDYAVSSKILLRAEYRYSDYGDYTYQGINTGLSSNRHQVIVGLTATF